MRQCRRDLEQALAEVRGSQRVLVQSQRLSAIGTIASGVAHDFKNALMLIMGSGEILLHDAERQRLTNENAIPLLQEILAAARDASTLVGHLRGFSRSGDTGEVHQSGQSEFGDRAGRLIHQAEMGYPGVRRGKPDPRES